MAPHRDVRLSVFFFSFSVLLAFAEGHSGLLAAQPGSSDPREEANTVAVPDTEEERSVGRDFALFESAQSSSEHSLLTPDQVQVSFTLRRDDGVSSNNFGPRTAIIANSLTPPKYPATLTEVQFRVSSSGDATPRDFEVCVFVDNYSMQIGPVEPFPAARRFCTPFFVSSFAALHTVAIPPQDQPTIYCGDFYVTVRDLTTTGTAFPYRLDNSLPQNRSWFSLDGGATWNPNANLSPNGDWALRGTVAVEREPCSCSVIAGDYRLQSFRGCATFWAEFAVNSSCSVTGLGGTGPAVFRTRYCGVSNTGSAECATRCGNEAALCSPAFSTDRMVNGLTVNTSTCSFQSPFNVVTFPQCTGERWTVTIVDRNTAIGVNDNEVFNVGMFTCGSNFCTNATPMSGYIESLLHPTENVVFETSTDLSWDTDPTATQGYDVLRGDLSCTQATPFPESVVCLTPSGVPGPPLTDTTAPPAVGACQPDIQGYFYLVRPGSSRQRGSLNACSNGQVAARNESPMGDCP